MTPLHNIEAEQALLGGLLFDNATLHRLPDGLKAEHFSEPVHGALYGEIVRRVRAERLADAVSLAEWWATLPAAAELGGPKYLLILLDHAARLTAQAVEYGELVLELAQRRALRDVLTETLESVARTDARDAVASLEQSLRAMDCADEHTGCSLHEAFDAWLEQAAQPSYRPLQTGFAALDRRVGGFYPGDLVIVAGRPSMGKTTFATNLARGFAHRGHPVHFASLEMGASQLAQRCTSAAAFESEPTPYQAMRSPERIDLAQLRRLRERLPGPLHIDARGGQTIHQIRSAARATRRRYGGLKAIIVDYLQIMGGQGSRYEKITETSGALKGLAKELDCTVIALSQLSRATESRDDKRPMLSDLRESGAIEQDADVVLGVYREHYYLTRSEPHGQDDSAWHRWQDACDRTARQCEIITLKNRMGAVGSDMLEMHVEHDVAMDAPASWGRSR